MIFTSIEFVIFFIIVLSIFWALRGRLFAQNTLILAASYFFYGYWDIRFLYLIVISTVVDYFCAQMIDNGNIDKKNQLKGASFLIGCTLLFVVLPTDMVLGNTAQAFSISTWLNEVIHNQLGLHVLAASIAILLLAKVLYPKLTKLAPAVRAKLFVTVSMVTNLSILGFFKYFNFFADSFSAMSSNLFGVTPASYTLDIILPVGISFYTFQTMSYTIDVYRKHISASTKLVDFAAFVSFFPQLVAGPIERGKHLLPQFQVARTVPSTAQIREGIWLIGWGFFKKMVIADNVAKITNSTFSAYDSANFAAATTDGGTLYVAVLAFAIQIYCDFSGYTDIARGTAKLFGFDLMLNFKLPYFAADPSSFWNRWHISLSSWLRDYLYIPLGGNRGGNVKTYRNLTLTMLLGGLWHGAAWNFIIWGAYHGLLLSVYRALGINTEREGYPKLKRILMTIFFFQLTCLGWLIFRAQNIETIGIVFSNIVFNPVFTAQTWSDLCTLFYYSWFLIFFQFIQLALKTLNPMAKFHWFIRFNIWIYIGMSIMVLAAKGEQEFIYFAF